jgi:SAM-dependent methyltransferase
MINLTQEYANYNNLSIPTYCLAWHQLPTEFDDIFDVVFCWGNSISHSQSKEEMLKNLSSFYQVLKDGGKVVVHSRNWEKVSNNMKKYKTLPVREYNNKRYIPVYCWNLNGFNQKSSVDILFVEIKEDQNTKYNKFQLEFVPFTYLDLINRLKEAGFKVIRDNYKGDNNFYHIVAEK